LGFYDDLTFNGFSIHLVSTTKSKLQAEKIKVMEKCNDFSIPLATFDLLPKRQVKMIENIFQIT
jgi:hypothetical protein